MSTASHTPHRRAARRTGIRARRMAWSEGNERQAHTGVLRLDEGVRRRLPLDLLGECAGVILIVGADDQELPAPDDRPALAAQLVRQRDRLVVRRELDPGL